MLAYNVVHTDVHVPRTAILLSKQLKCIVFCCTLSFWSQCSDKKSNVYSVDLYDYSDGKHLFPFVERAFCIVAVSMIIIVL